MDRNWLSSNHHLHYIGQARKSLWIETQTLLHPIVTQAGQARKSLWIETEKAFIFKESFIGQARKSLWIETLNFLIG